jgi:dolichol-phosphate mannosyltransferase
LADALDLSIIIPTYNERETLPTLVERVFSVVDPRNTELIVVDDDSPDRTADVARALAGKYPVRCIVRTTDRGLAPAVLEGLKQARGRLAVVMDCDLSHPPESIPAIIAAMNEPVVQMAVGSRFVEGGTVDLDWPLHRRIISRAGRLLARPLTPVRDMVSGFFCVRPAKIRFERLRPIGYKIALELIVRHGWNRVVEVPIRFSDRVAGQTKLNMAEQWRYLRHLARLYGYVLSGQRRRDAN